MLKRLCSFVAVALLIGSIQTIAASLKAPSITLHSQDVQLPGPGTAYTGVAADLLNRNCALCHSPTFVDKQPALSAQTWKSEILKMKDVFGAPIDASVIPDLVKALTDRHGTPEGDQNGAPEAAGASG